MEFEISKEKLSKLIKQTEYVVVNNKLESVDVYSNSCGNNCRGTCEWSPCTNVYAATH